MSKHTPGPWVLIRQDGKNDSAIATVEKHPEGMDLPNFWTVGNVNRLRDEWQANARLFCAAPELLEAVRIAKQLASIASDWNLDEVEIDGEMVSTCELETKFAAVLAKAEGKS